MELEIYKPMVTPTDDGTLWLQLLSNHQIDELIKNTNAANFAPKTILNLFDSLRLVGIYSALTDAFVEDSFPNPALMREARDGLVNLGFRQDLVARFLFLLLRIFSPDIRVEDLQKNKTFSDAAIDIAMHQLAGYNGPPDLQNILWILENSVDEQHAGARELLRQLRATADGDEGARFELVTRCIPYWREMMDLSFLSDQDRRPESLGVIFEWSRKISLDPDSLTLIAEMYYLFGHAGDEDRACDLAVQAAYLGSAEAWNLLADWSRRGDESRVLYHLLELGRKRFVTELPRSI